MEETEEACGAPNCFLVVNVFNCNLGHHKRDDGGRETQRGKWKESGRREIIVK